MDALGGVEIDGGVPIVGAERQAQRQQEPGEDEGEEEREPEERAEGEAAQAPAFGTAGASLLRVGRSHHHATLLIARRLAEKPYREPAGTGEWRRKPP